jgi:hypothetical protein
VANVCAIYNPAFLCFICGTDRILKYYLDALWVSEGWRKSQLLVWYGRSPLNMRCGRQALNLLEVCSLKQNDLQFVRSACLKYISRFVVSAGSSSGKPLDLHSKAAGSNPQTGHRMSDITVPWSRPWLRQGRSCFNSVESSSAVSYFHYRRKTVDYNVYVYYLTPRNGALLEKLTVAQLVKKFPAVYGTRRVITCLRLILILFSHQRLRLPSGVLPSGFPTKILYAFSIAPCVLLVRPMSFVWCDHLTNIWLRDSLLKCHEC